MLKFLLALFTALFSNSAAPSKSSSEMNEGDFHSGPHGYSPNTAYVETEYGDLNWEDEEH